MKQEQKKIVKYLGFIALFVLDFSHRCFNPNAVRIIFVNFAQTIWFSKKAKHNKKHVVLMDVL